MLRSRTYYQNKVMFMAEQRGCYSYTIEPRDIDQTHRVTYVALGDYILQAAGEDADRNGFGVRNLNCANCSWVLSRMAMALERRPEQYEQIVVRTWVNEVSRLMTTRNMVITGEHGRPVGAVVTQWAMIDLDKRTPLDIRAHLDYDRAVVEEPSPIDKPVRIPQIQPAVEVRHRVVYSDIDFNGHTNSLKYWEWMFDMLPLSDLTDRLLTRIDVNYHHEALYGQELVLCCDEAPNPRFEIHDEAGITLCRAALTWK